MHDQDQIQVREEHGETTVIFYTVNLDQRARTQIEKDLLEVARRCDLIVLDMRKVEFADSAGLRMILNVLNENNKGHLVNVGHRFEKCLHRLPEHRRPPYRTTISNLNHQIKLMGACS